MSPKLEVCLDNFESVKAAVDGGAHRVELCSSLLDGGLTPSVGLLRRIKRVYADLCIFAMIRPRGGDFCYSSDELEIMLADIEVLAEAGADGFVFGCLADDGSVDWHANSRLLKSALPLPCTFHRAFDMAKDMENSLEIIIKLGFRRILTSGQSKSALEGVQQISELINRAQGRIVIMPGSGVSADNLDLILHRTKAVEFHSSASVVRLSSMTYRNPKISMGSGSAEFEWKVCQAEKVKKLIEISNKYP